MLRFREISEDTALFPWNKSTPYPALESTVAVVLALGLGQLTGHESAGSIAAGAAFTVGFAVFHEALSSTLLSMAVLTLGIASATLAGSLGAHWTPLVLVLCVVAAINYGLLAGLGNTAGWIGQQCAVFVVISSYFAHGVHYAAGRSAMVLLGGALQMLVYSVWHLRFHFVGNRASRPPFWRQVGTRARQLGRALRDELHWRGETTWYVLRLIITLALSTTLYRTLHWQNGYWAPMTVLLVLKPQWAGTLSRGVARLAGTLVGASLCALLALHPPFPHWFYVVGIAVCAWACFALQAVNYALFSAFLTLYVVFLFAFGGFSQRSAADARLLNTALGGLLALAVDFVAQRLRQRHTHLPGAAPASSALDAHRPAANQPSAPGASR